MRRISFGASGIGIGLDLDDDDDEDLEDSPGIVADDEDDFLEVASVSMEELRFRFIRSKRRDFSMDESSPCDGGAGLRSRGATEAGRLCSVSVLCRAAGIANGGVGA